MIDNPLSPIAAFDIREGNSDPVTDAWPELRTDAIYRWLHLDLSEPGSKDWIRERLPEIAARALWQSETRPRCERLDKGLILNLRGVNLNPESDPEDMVSLRLWVAEHVIVSARYRQIHALDDMRSSAEDGSAPASVGQFLSQLTHRLTNQVEAISLALEEQTDQLEENVAEGHRLPVDRLSRLRQTVIKIRRFLNPQREAIYTLANLENWIIKPEELALLRETSNRTRRIVEELDATRDRLTALQDHVDADRAHKLSRNSYFLSIVAAIFLPLSFLTSLFGVNIAGMPGTSAPMAFWILTAVCAVGAVCLFLIFKFSKWL